MSEVEQIRFTSANVGEIRERAAACTAPLIWLLHESALPEPNALPLLLEHAPGPVASMPIDSQGRPLLALLGRTTEQDPEGILEAAKSRCLPLRSRVFAIWARQLPKARMSPW